MSIRTTTRARLCEAVKTRRVSCPSAPDTASDGMTSAVDIKSSAKYYLIGQFLSSMLFGPTAARNKRTTAQLLIDDPSLIGRQNIHYVSY